MREVPITTQGVKQSLLASSARILLGGEWLLLMAELGTSPLFAGMACVHPSHLVDRGQCGFLFNPLKFASSEGGELLWLKKR